MIALAAGLILSAAAAMAQGRGGGAGGGGGIVGGGGGGGGTNASATRQYPNATLLGDATVTSDVDTRSLIVVTDATTNENIKLILAALDKPKPQVLINVVFLQVTHDNSFDLGAEATYKGPVSIKTNPDGTATTNFGIAQQRAVPNNTFYGAFYQLVGRDINATIHAMSGVTKTEILSRPSVLTRSNQQATILVGQKVPILTGTTQNTNSNSITSTVTYQNVGIILSVTPFITNEGLVEMIVSPQISSLSANSVQLAGGGTSPVIDTRQADTVVVTPSDHTIVIGGLISTQKNNTDTKVPLLGDIPILGYAFKRNVKEDVKTELLIFLTPHVVARPEDLESLSESERAKLNLAPTTFEPADLSRFVPGATAPAKK